MGTIYLIVLKSAICSKITVFIVYATYFYRSMSQRSHVSPKLVACDVMTSLANDCIQKGYPEDWRPVVDCRK